MKRTSILASFIFFQSVLCWFSLAIASAQPLTSRSVTASAYIERGAVLFAKGEYERALADYNQAIALAPGYVQAWLDRGALLKAQGDLERAAADLSRAIELNPELAVAWAKRGLARLLQGREEEAQQDFDRCLALNIALKLWLNQRIVEAKRQLMVKPIQAESKKGFDDLSPAPT